MHMLRGFKYLIGLPFLIVSFQNFGPLELDVDHRPRPVREANKLQNKQADLGMIPQGEGGAGYSKPLTIPIFPFEYKPSSNLPLPSHSESTGYRSEFNNEIGRAHV